MKKINLNKYFQKPKKNLNLKPLIIAEISANHGGSKKKFLNLIKSDHYGNECIDVFIYYNSIIVLK